MHPALHALESLLPLPPGSIESITLRTNPRSWAPRARNRRPTGAVTCQFNLPHAAAMLVSGVPPGPRWYEDDVLGDPHVGALRERVAVELDLRTVDAKSRDTDGVIREPPGAAEVICGGRTHGAAVGAPEGASWWEASELGDDAIREKLALMTGGEPPDGLAELVGGLADLDEVRELGRLVGGRT
jgi:2-methylcitrate dehydratase PrpD